MKPALFLTFLILSLKIQATVFSFVPQTPFMSPDSVPEPPGNPAMLSGPTTACLGDTSVYSTEVPVACSCQWSVDGVVQPETSPLLTVIWDQAGEREVAVAFACQNGGVTDPETLTVNVFGVPAPTPIQGDELVCEYTYHTYSTTVGPLDSCEWTVNGVIQATYGPTLEYSFGDEGIYTFQVIAYNPCGTSAPQLLDVTAQGSAPAPPSPIQGPEVSCEESTETYTTTVEQGETCSWWIDGILQPEISTTLEVTWNEQGVHLIEARAVSDCGTGNPVFKEVSVFYQPNVFLGNDTAIIQGQTLTLDAGNPGSEYLWSTGETTQTILVMFAGAYSVSVSNYCGTDNDTIEVSVAIGIKEKPDRENCFEIDLVRRTVYFKNLPEAALTVQVFNLQGNLIYGGDPINFIHLDHPGIYIFRVITPDKTCYKKLFIR